jgi:hypothetical protein
MRAVLGLQQRRSNAWSRCLREVGMCGFDIMCACACGVPWLVYMRLVLCLTL